VLLDFIHPQAALESVARNFFLAYGIQRVKHDKDDITQSLNVSKSIVKCKYACCEVPSWQ
jgi:hypothetical protein